MRGLRQIDRALSRAKRLPLDSDSRYIIMSDCHRGEGNVSDRFLKNRQVYLTALEYYFREGFHYLELGDGEELWENRNAEHILEYHEAVYRMFERFRRRERITRLYGERNLEWQEGLEEALLLENREGGRNIYLLHGHQADFFYTHCPRAARFLARASFQLRGSFGSCPPLPMEGREKRQERCEKKLAGWAAEKDAYLAAGHFHHPRLPEDGTLYLNPGDGIHPYGVTGIEIEEMKITLVKWSVKVGQDMIFYVDREVLGKPVPIR